MSLLSIYVFSLLQWAPDDALAFDRTRLWGHHVLELLKRDGLMLWRRPSPHYHDAEGRVHRMTEDLYGRVEELKA